MSDRLKFAEDVVNDLQSTGLYNEIKVIGSAQGAWIEIEGRKVDRKSVV